MRPPSGDTPDIAAAEKTPPNDDPKPSSSGTSRERGNPFVKLQQCVCFSHISCWHFFCVVGKPTRCSCGNLIVHIQQDENGRPLSPRNHTVFNRLYRHRLTKELHHRKLAAEQIQKEARECTYIPFTNHVRQKLTSTSSLSGIAHRERTIEIARERFNQGNMCVECPKNVEISTGTYVLNDEVSSTWC